jgi:hypothetical protein
LVIIIIRKKTKTDSRSRQLRWARQTRRHFHEKEKEFWGIFQTQKFGKQNGAV